MANGALMDATLCYASPQATFNIIQKAPYTPPSMFKASSTARFIEILACPRIQHNLTILLSEPPSRHRMNILTTLTTQLCN